MISGRNTLGFIEDSLNNERSSIDTAERRIAEVSSQLLKLQGTRVADYRELARLLATRRKGRETFIDRAIAALEPVLEAAGTGLDRALRCTVYLTSMADLQKIPLGMNDKGTPVRLQDVADIRMGPQLRRGISELNGEGEVVGAVVVARYLSPRPTRVRHRRVAQPAEPRAVPSGDPFTAGETAAAKILQPGSENPATGKPYGADFPIITIGDMVDVEKRLKDHLGIDTLYSVIGGSMGGMYALEWGLMFPDRVRSLVPLATTAAASPPRPRPARAGSAPRPRSGSDRSGC